MSLASDLLEQAELLSKKEPMRPKQASLRRAVSTAYYSLFHLLLEETSVVVASGNLTVMQPLVARSLEHGVMKAIAKSFASGWGGLPTKLKPRFTNPISADLILVVTTFVQLQQQRHEADYNVEERFLRADTTRLIKDAQAAFDAWKRIRRTNEARQFLLCLLLGKSLDRS